MLLSKRRFVCFSLFLILLIYLPVSCSNPNTLTSSSSPKASSSSKIISSSSLISTSSMQLISGNTGAVSENTPVSDSYFNDCVFIGDSITSGLQLYNIVQNSTIIYHSGLNTSTALTDILDINGKKSTIADSLKELKPKYIYILIGSNDVEWMPQRNFINNYTKFVQEIKMATPNSVVYIQSIFPVTLSYAEKIKKSKNPTFSNSTIDNYNSLILNIANENGAHYLDVAQALKDKTNVLPANMSDDGIHLRISGYTLWINYIKTHTIKG